MINLLRLECKFEEKPHISVNLDALSETVIAGSSIIVPITFRPLEQVHYRDNLHFTINSTIEKKITITGEGITYKVRYKLYICIKNESSSYIVYVTY